jgi:predicted RNase H-like HicB family nuclease
MRYPAIITKEGKKTLANFVDCPGCQTETDPGEDISIQAADALTGCLEAHLFLGRVPPQPSTRKPRGKVRSLGRDAANLRK